MAGLDFGNAFGFFNANDMSDPRVNSLLRQRIALSMLAQKKGFPKNIGEGLTAIGDAIGDRGILNRLARGDLADQELANSMPPGMAAPAATAAPQQPSSVPGRAASLADASTDETEPVQPARSQDAAQPSQLTTAPVQPSSVLSPVMPTGLTAPQATLRDLGPPGQVAARAAGPADGAGPAAIPARRAAIAGALAAQAQKPPVMAADDSAPVQFNNPTMLPMPPQTGAPRGMDGRVPVMAQSYPAAPPPRIPAAPPAAAGQPPSIPGYVPPMPREPIAPAMIPPSREEQQLEGFVNRGLMVTPDMARGPAAMRLKQLQDARAYEQTRQTEAYKEQLQAYRMQQQQRNEMQGTQQGRIDTANEAARKAQQFGQYGGLDPKDVYAEAVKTRDTARSAREALFAANDARTAIQNGAIMGSGANTRLDVAKFLYQWGFKPSNDAAANTEFFRSRMAAMVGPLRRELLAGSTSDTDRQFVIDAAGGNASLEPQAVMRLLDAVGRTSREMITRHNNTMQQYYGQDPKAMEAFNVPMPDFPKQGALAPTHFNSMEDAKKAKLDKNTIVVIDGKKYRVQ